MTNDPHSNTGKTAPILREIPPVGGGHEGFCSFALTERLMPRSHGPSSAVLPLLGWDFYYPRGCVHFINPN